MRCICNFRYARSRRGGRGVPDVRGLLKYVQYRDGRDGHIPDAGGPDRWVDGGLGSNYQSILSRLDRLSAGNPHAYCFSVVISPDPKAMERVDGDPHAQFVEAVKATIQGWEDWRRQTDPSQAGPIEYSFLVHRPARDYGEQLHAHLILPAATEHPATRTMTPLYNNRPHMERFKEIAYHQLDRAFGLDREPALDKPEPEQPHASVEDVVDEREIEFIRFFEHQAQDPSQGVEA
jgi:hypothetical protein